ncbi:MAG: hypothetical protein NTV21_19445, partial [Planctomycetota bacterium]|nr:hypothetical protein [Planctomycetota bacterium]
EKKAPATRTTVHNPEQALKGEFSAAADTVDPVALADRLVAIGPGAAPSILRGLCGHLDLEALDEAGTGAPADIRDRALRDAWARYSPAIRLAAIEDEADFAGTDGARVLIGLAGETGDAAAVPLVLELAGRLDPIQLARPYVVEPIERALITCLPAALESRAVANQLAALRGPLSEIVARAAILCGSALAQEIAFAHLGRSTATDLALLVTLTTPGLDTRRTLHGPQLETLRTLTTARSPEIRRAACVAIGHARDGGGVEELVACLDDIDPLVCSAARNSLRLSTGKDKGASTEEWQSWLEERTRWLDEVAPGIVETIRGEDYEQVVSSVDRLFERGDARQEWTELCTELLDSDSPRVVRRATEALLQIGSADELLAIEHARARLGGPRLRMLEAALTAAQ